MAVDGPHQNRGPFFAFRVLYSTVEKEEERRKKK
jgi:hypothetical protein